MLTRENALHTWLNNLVDYSTFNLTPLAGDASFRRYFRLSSAEKSFVVMDDPSTQSSLTAFVEVGQTLSAHHVRTPKVLAVDLKQGFALLEDFGDTLLYDEVTSEDANNHYQLALQTIHKIQQCNIAKTKIGTFDVLFMQNEFELFRTWFLERWLEITLTDAEKTMLTEACNEITRQIIKQPQCLIHRDYHAQNISLIGPKHQKSLGLLDFQDAVLGPFTYDLASLLKDARVTWSETIQQKWLDYFYEHLPNHYNWSKAAFERGFHLCGLQLHLKILGIFCRLNLRDQKPHYLKYLPRLFDDILISLNREKKLLPFYDFMKARVRPIFNKKMNTIT